MELSPKQLSHSTIRIRIRWVRLTLAIKRTRLSTPHIALTVIVRTTTYFEVNRDGNSGRRDGSDGGVNIDDTSEEGRLFEPRQYFEDGQLFNFESKHYIYFDVK